MIDHAADDDLATLRRGVERAGLDIAEIVLPADRQVILRDMRFHYLDWGNDGAPPIVLLHGGGLTAHTYDIVCLALRTDHHCVALDLRGHGDSEWSPVMDYSLHAYAGDAGALIEHLGLSGVVLVGQSLGGLTALQYATEHADRLRGLVIIDVGPDIQFEGARRIREFMLQPNELDSIEDYVARAKAFNPLRDERALLRSLRHNLRRTPAGKWTWKYDVRHRGKIDPEERSRRYRRLWEAIDRITCPTLVVRGGDSDLFSDANAQDLAARLPRARPVTVPGAGHTVQGDAPGGLVAVLRTFLAEVGGR